MYGLANLLEMRCNKASARRRALTQSLMTRVIQELSAKRKARPASRATEVSIKASHHLRYAFHSELQCSTCAQPSRHPCNDHMPHSHAKVHHANFVAHHDKVREEIKLHFPIYVVQLRDGILT